MFWTKIDQIAYFKTYILIIFCEKSEFFIFFCKKCFFQKSTKIGLKFGQDIPVKSDIGFGMPVYYDRLSDYV